MTLFSPEFAQREAGKMNKFFCQQGGSAADAAEPDVLAGRVLSFVRQLFPAAVLLLMGALAGPIARAQDLATLSGTVTDPSHAAVSGAQVEVRNVETGLRRSSGSDPDGRFLFPSLPVGTYELHATKPGFSEEIHTGVQLLVGQSAVVDMGLQVGSQSEQVTVAADAPSVSLTTQDVSGLVGQQQVKDLPLNGRSYDLLMELNPGVVNFTFEKTGGTGVSNSTNANNFSTSGQRPQQNLFLLDGIEFTGAAENNMQPGGTSGVLLGVEAVREFNVLRDSYGAQYGKHPGAQVAIVTQSGSSAFHGDLYEYLRNNDLDSRNFFDVGSAPLFQRNQFGVSGGGPILKNNTFVFANYEGFRQNLHQTSVTFVPDANARSGGFVTPGSACPAAQRAACATIVNQILNLWPVANGAEQLLPGGAQSGIAELTSSPFQRLRDDFGTIRLDHIFSDRDSWAGVYTVDDSAAVTATPLDPYSTDISDLREQVVSLKETHVFSPDFVTTARLGFSRASYYFLGEPTPGTPAANVTSFVGTHPVGAVVVGGSTASNPAAQLGLAGSNNGTNLPIHRNLYTYEDQVDWIRGGHDFSFGAWFQQFQSNETIALSQYGQMSFASINALLGGMGTITFNPAPTEMNWRSLFAAWFAQDTLRVTDRLTVTLGFRGESSTGWNEAHGRAANYFFTNGVINSTPHIGASAFSSNNQRFLPEPRVAAAWSPFGDKTVVRAGFGIYNDLQDALGYRMDQNAPYNPVYTGTVPVSDLPITTIPAGLKLAPGGVQPNLKPPTLISYSLRIQQRLTPNTSVTVGYLGSHGYHELIGVDTNEPAPITCPGSGAAVCPANYPTLYTSAGATVAGPTVPAGVHYISTACSAATPSCNSTLANPWTWLSLGGSSYNALQLDLNHRFHAGLSLRGVYTWSKALDDGDSVNGTTSNNAVALVADPFNIRGDWAPATYDVRNVGVISALYELPFGTGKTYASNTGGVARLLVSGWSVNSIVTLQGGFPFTPQLGYNPSRNGDTKNPVRPFKNPSFTGPVIIGKPDEWFNPNAFLYEPNNGGFYGNVGRDAYQGPGLATWDFSAIKQTALTEKISLQFRAEIFNLLDRANFNTPNLIVALLTPPPAGSTTASAIPEVNPVGGQITSTSTTSRQVQFGLKLLW